MEHLIIESSQIYTIPMNDIRLELYLNTLNIIEKGFDYKYDNFEKS